MKKWLASVVCLGLAALVTTVAGGDKTAKIDGTWILTSAISNGKKVPDDILAKFMPTAMFKDGKYEMSIMGNLEEAGAYKLDAAKKPATIDLIIEKGRDKGMTQLGIFKIEGNTVTIALTKPGKDNRPKEFESSADVEVQTLKRK
jgi:uncharacterized protein (TIGR03067 family)